MNEEQFQELQEKYAQEGRFDRDVMPYSTHNLLPIDENYEFLCTKPQEKVLHAVLYFFASILWRPVLFFGLGFRVRGKENRKKVKGGAIAVSNHVHYLDAVMVHALHPLPWKIFHTGGAFNVKKGILGALIKAINYLPLSNSFGAQKNFVHTVRELLGHGYVVHFYPEHAFWLRYEKLRPFKPGAFRYAAKFNVPVLPSVITFEQTPFRKFFHMKKRAVLNILPPVYPLEGLSERENAARMCEECHAAMEKVIEVNSCKNV